MHACICTVYSDVCITHKTVISVSDIVFLTGGGLIELNWIEFIKNNVFYSLCHQNSYFYHTVTDIYRMADKRAKRPPGTAAQVCSGPADTADMRRKVFLMNLCPNTFPPSGKVWKQPIAHWMFFSPLFPVTWSESWQFCFLLVDSDRKWTVLVLGGQQQPVARPLNLLFIDLVVCYLKSRRR